MILVCFNFLLKQTFTGLRVMVATTILLAAFAVFTWPMAIEQSKTQIADWLQNTGLMRDMAVILTLDVVAQLTFCIFTVRMPMPEKARRRSRIIQRFLAVYPSLAVFPVVFGGLVELIFSLPGVSFTLIACSLGGLILLVVPLGSRLLRMLLPENDLRLEMLFLSNVLVAGIGVVATVNGDTQNSPAENVDFVALALFAALFAGGFVLGLIWYKWVRKKYFKH